MERTSMEWFREICRQREPHLSSRASKEAVSSSNSYRDTMGASAEFVEIGELVEPDELVKKL
jgi:hypothetical protein